MKYLRANSVAALALSGLAALGVSTSARAGDRSYVSVAVTRADDESQADDTKARDEKTLIDVSGAWVQPGGLSLGLKYFNYNENGDQVVEGGTNTSGYGPMIGFYHVSGAFLNLAYLYKPTKKYNDDGTHVEFNGGAGYVVDLGKVFEMGAWGVGLQVTYSKVTYKNMNTGTDEKLSGTWCDTSTYPYLSLFVYL